MIELDSKRLLEHFVDIPDPRKANGQLRKLSDIILISLLAVISAYGQAKQAWLSTFLGYPTAIPSQDTFNRVFSILKSSLWQSRFLTWAQELGVSASKNLLRVLEFMRGRLAMQPEEKPHCASSGRH